MTGDWPDLADFGPFFQLATAPGPADRARRPLADLVTDPALLRARIAVTGAALARPELTRAELTRAELTGGSGRAVERRVAGSIFQVDLFARLLSPLLAIALLRNEIVHPTLDQLHWQPVANGLRLSLPDGAPRTVVDDPSGLANQFGRLVLAGPVTELVDAIGASCRLSARIGWGNVASALNGATIVLAAVRPALAGPAHRLAAEVLAAPPLNLTGIATGTAFRRNSCCLLYRVTGRQAICADCVLAAAWTGRPLR